MTKGAVSLVFIIFLLLEGGDLVRSSSSSDAKACDITINNVNNNHVTVVNNPSPSPSPSSCPVGTILANLSAPGNYTIPKPTGCTRIGVTLCGGGGSGSNDCSDTDSTGLSGGGGAACIVNVTLDTSSLPSTFLVSVGAGGSSYGSYPQDGEPSGIFLGSISQLIAPGGKASAMVNGGSGGGGGPFPPGGSGGVYQGNPDGEDGKISGATASGAGGGASGVPAGKGGSVGMGVGGPASAIADCCPEGSNCVGGGGASFLGDGGSLDPNSNGIPPGIGGGGTLTQDGGDGVVIIFALQ